MIAIDLANAVFLICVAVAGLLLMVGLLLDDEIGPLLDFLRLRRGVRGVPIVVYVLAFILGFGIGGFIGTAGMNAEALPAFVFGLVAGLLAIVIVWSMSDTRTLRKVGVEKKLDLDDLVGHRGRISMPLVSGALGTVSVTYRGTEREFPATTTVDIPAGSLVVIDDVDDSKSTLVVMPVSHTKD